MSVPVNIVVALNCEAKPLIEHFGLDKVIDLTDFPVYVNNRIKLVCSGVGKQAIAEATKFLANYDTQNHHQAYLNVGIAGHSTLAIGTGVLANKIIDRATAKVWYPTPFLSSTWKNGQIITVDKVELEYKEDACYDMEAASFYRAAYESSIADLIFSYKIISDNRSNSIHKITRSLVNRIVSSQIPNIQLLVKELSERAVLTSDQFFQYELTETFFEKWRFTVTQKQQMKKLVNQCSVLGIELRPESDLIAHCRDSRAVIHGIRKLLNSHWKSI